MVQIKAWIFYLDVYTKDSYKWDKKLIFLWKLHLQQVLQLGLYSRSFHLFGLL